MKNQTLIDTQKAIEFPEYSKGKWSKADWYLYYNKETIRRALKLAIEYERTKT